jgi:hypothetical protein
MQTPAIDTWFPRYYIEQVGRNLASLALSHQYLHPEIGETIVWFGASRAGLVGIDAVVISRGWKLLRCDKMRSVCGMRILEYEQTNQNAEI